MTHDELLIEINRRLDVALYNGDAQSIHALRAVAEKHTPFTPEFGGGDDYCFADDRPYPCPTIQAIEKELA
jgi:hypothetical protein